MITAESFTFFFLYRISWFEIHSSSCFISRYDDGETAPFYRERKVCDNINYNHVKLDSNDKDDCSNNWNKGNNKIDDNYNIE